MKVADVLHENRCSDCSTAPFRHMTAAGTNDIRNIDNGYLEGGAATSLYSHTYVSTRIAIVSNDMPAVKPAASPSINYVVDFRLAVWDYDTRVLRATTANLASVLNALPRESAFDTELPNKYTLAADLLEPLFLHQGERVLMGTCLYGDYPCRGIGNASVNAWKPVMAASPQLGFNNKSSITNPTQAGQFPTGGYTGGVPGTIGTDVSGNAPWMDLIHEADEGNDWGFTSESNW